jgi:peptidoglycan/LPS O-acetylase OafA/YrhL
LKYRAEIDGLRALAVLPVILFHAGFELFSGGFVGVDVFFVISGYLITTILIEDIENKRFSIINFYERRARRILPALFFVMLVCIPFAWMWMLPSQMKDFSQSLFAVSLFASNILFWRESGYFAPAAEEMPLLHTWSLAVEEQYYVLFPIFLILAWRFGKSRVFWMIVVMAAFSLLLSEWGWRNKPTANFYLAPTRAWELFAGSIAAFIVQKQGVQKNNFLSLIGLAAIIFSIFVFDEATPFPSLYALVPVLGVVLLVLYADKKTFAAKLLGTKGFVGVGLISYSAYLWHQPLFAFAQVKSIIKPSYYQMAFLALLSLSLAYLSWRFIETPFRSKKKMSRSKIFAFSLSGLVMFSMLGLYGHIKNGLYERFPDHIAQILSVDMNKFEDSVRQCWDALEDSPNLNAACSLGAINEKNSFALIGDSHAGALQKTLSNTASEIGISGIGLSYQSCPPLANANDTLNDDICTNLRDSIFSVEGIQSLPHNVIVSARWALLTKKERYLNDSGVRESGSDWVWDLNSDDDDDYTEAMKNEITSSLNLIVASGRHLIIVYPVPKMGWEVPMQLAHSLIIKDTLTDLSASVGVESFQIRNVAAFAALDAVGGENLSGIITRIYPHEILCEQRCLAHLNGIPLYFDDDHLSQLGASELASDILDSIRYE